MQTRAARRKGRGLALLKKTAHPWRRLTDSPISRLPAVLGTRHGLNSCFFAPYTQKSDGQAVARHPSPSRKLTGVLNRICRLTMATS